MTIRNVGPNSTYPTIAAAVAAAAEGDTIRLEQGYSNERAVLTVQDLTVTGGATSRNIDLVLDIGINDVTLYGLADIEVLDNTGSNMITGNRGSNTVQVSGGADVVHGGDGRDLLVVDYADAVTGVVATAGNVTDGGTKSVTFDAVEDIHIYSGYAPDTLTMGDGDHWLDSGNGNDTITAGEGDTEIDSGGGHDTITAHGGVVDAGYGNDTISMTNGGLVFAGPGNDTVTTGDGDSEVAGEAGDDTVTTGGGDDIVWDGRGDDTLKTGSGDDRVQTSGGIDTADAGAGHDLLTVGYFAIRDVTVRISAGSGVEGYSGVAADATGSHSVSFTGFEHFYIFTGRGDDDVRIGAGDDTVLSGWGDDFVRGGAGNDWLKGSDGTDTISGGRGADDMEGGRGADVFRFDDLDSLLGAADFIYDLRAVDTIDLSRIDADVTAAGDQAFVLVDRFSGAAGEAVLSVQASGHTSRLILDTDGDRVAEIAIHLSRDQSGFDHFVL